MSLENLTVINLQPNSAPTLEYKNSIIINTCQRTIVAGFFNIKNDSQDSNFFHGPEAYKFLLEVICGLKSKIIAEYEIVSQFKAAYHYYLTLPSPDKDGKLIKIIEKLFKDSKEIRTDYLLGISHESYAGITKKILIQNYFNQDILDNSITILGSGKLAEDIIKNSIRKFQINVIARNTDRLEELQSSYGINPVYLGHKTSVASYSCLINTIGTESILFNDDNLFNEWISLHAHRIFIDLGSPSSIQSTHTIKEGMYLLNDFFEAAQHMSLEKKQKIELAKIAINALVIKRDMIFKKSWTNSFSSQETSSY